MLSLYLSLIENEEDRIKFEELYYSYRKQMLSVAFEIINNYSDAEDAVQAAFLGIARQFNKIKLDHPKMVKAYVFTVTKNEALRIKSGNERLPIDIDADIDTIQANDHQQDPFHIVRESQDYDRLISAMKKVPQMYSEVLMLKYIHELKVSEIAKTLNRNPATVRKQLERGKQMLLTAYMGGGQQQ